MKLAKRNPFFQKRRSRLDLTIEHNTQAETPSKTQIEKFVLAALQGLYDESIISMIFVDEAEGRALNLEHRGKDYATNVLSFALNEGEDTPANLPLFGDLVLCCPVVEKEAQAQNRPLLDHYAHLIVHGILHLQGYDHIKDDEAEEMESLETRILAKLGFPDPYLEEKI